MEYLQKVADAITKQPTDTTSLTKAKAALDCGRTNSNITGIVFITILLHCC